MALNRKLLRDWRKNKWVDNLIILFFNWVFQEEIQEKQKHEYEQRLEKELDLRQKLLKQVEEKETQILVWDLFKFTHIIDYYIATVFEVERT